MYGKKQNSSEAPSSCNSPKGLMEITGYLFDWRQPVYTPCLCLK